MLKITDELMKKVERFYEDEVRPDIKYKSVDIDDMNSNALCAIIELYDAEKGV